MSAEGLAVVAAMTLAGSLAILGVLALRVSIRRGFGAQVAYAMWVAIPLIACAVLLPAPVEPVVVFMHVASVGTPVRLIAAGETAAFDLRGVLFGLWLLGVGLSAAWFVLQQRRYLRSLGRLSDVASEARIVRSEFDADGPALVGAWRPRIVLPRDFDRRYAAGERELILAHERVHMARGDARINAFVVALRCLNWFNPLVHLAAAKFRLDQELACDAAVIARFPEARRPYADAMLKVQLAGQPRQELRLPAGCRWPSGHPLKERIAMLKQPLPTRARRASGVAVVAAAIACGSFASWAAQPARTEAIAAASDGPASERASYRRLKPPVYPPSSAASGIEGVVFVTAAIDADGHVTSASVDRAEPVVAGFLGDAAVKAVEAWTFNPAKQNDKAVASRIVVPLRFALSDPKTVPVGALPPNALEIIDVVAHPSEKSSMAKAPPPPLPPPPPSPPPPPNDSAAAT